MAGLTAYSAGDRLRLPNGQRTFDNDEKTGGECGFDRDGREDSDGTGGDRAGAAGGDADARAPADRPFGEPAAAGGGQRPGVLRKARFDGDAGSDQVLRGGERGQQPSVRRGDGDQGGGAVQAVRWRLPSGRDERWDSQGPAGAGADFEGHGGERDYGGVILRSRGAPQRHGRASGVGDNGGDCKGRVGGSGRNDGEGGGYRRDRVLLAAG